MNRKNIYGCYRGTVFNFFYYLYRFQDKEHERLPGSGLGTGSGFGYGFGYGSCPVSYLETIRNHFYHPCRIKDDEHGWLPGSGFGTGSGRGHGSGPESHFEINNNPLYLNIYLRRIMADEYERLLEVLDVPPGEEGAEAAEAAEATGADHDESLLDVEDEVCILDPPLLPTPAEPPTVSTAIENDKVNAEIMDLDDISETHSSQNTQSSFLTTYSKYGIRGGFSLH
jgi:hypothetical protein